MQRRPTSADVAARAGVSRTTVSFVLNGRVDVKIPDTTRQRVLDVSRAAAEELGMIANGTARVRVEQLEAESLAVKDIAINGGGPDEQRAALDKGVAGRRGPPAGGSPGPPWSSSRCHE